MEQSLGGAAFRKELGGAAAETTSGESMVLGLHYNRMFCSHEAQKLARYESVR